MKFQYFIHMHRRGKALAFGRASGDVREVTFQPAYPVRDQEEAIQWFHLCVDTVATSSKCEWWCIEDEWPQADREHPDARDKLREAAQEAFGVATPATSYQ